MPREAPRARDKRKQSRRGRALERAAFLASRAGEFDRPALDAAMSRAVKRAERAAKKTATTTTTKTAAAKKGVAKKASAVLPKAFPTGDVKRWVPIGPSVVRRGQAEGRPRITGRVTDLAVSGDGQRAYAGSAKGGVWYTEDAGATWVPVGGWAERRGSSGGDNNAQSVGCLNVVFGATKADDFVLVGTGELQPSMQWSWTVTPAAGQPQQGGIGVLVAKGPADQDVGANPWEKDAGLGVLEGVGIFRIVRDPLVASAQAGTPGVDRVFAATSSGLFLGTRVHVAAAPAHDEYTWIRVAGLDAIVPAAPSYQVTDVQWIATGATTSRLIVAIDSAGVAFSDNLTSFTWVTNLDVPASAVPIIGRLSLSDKIGPRMYVLGERTLPPTPPATNPALTPTLWQIPSVVAAAPTAVQIPGVPVDIWGTQRDYDQAIAVEIVNGTDRVYLAGSFKQPTATGEFGASLWCFDVSATPALVPSPGVSRTGAPAGGDGADVAGLIGNNVHADVHVVRLADVGGPTRQVWVGCDGGVFVSGQAGRVNTFRPRSTGMANLEPGFLATHPTSSHFMAIGCQDNGTQVRAGDTVWEEILEGDGGGTLFHPTRPHYVVAQYIRGNWLGRPMSGFVDPLHRTVGGQYEPTPQSREWWASSFYSGAAAIRASATASRIAVGTNRVWLSDDIGAGANWRTIPAGAVAGVVTDPRPGGTDPVAKQNVGVPPGNLGAVVALRWVTPTDLLAIYAQGLVRYVENPANHRWTATVLVPSPPGPASAPAITPPTIITDVAPVPGTSDFFMTTSGDATTPGIDTCYFYSAASNTFAPTGLRHALDQGPTLGPLDPAYAVVVDPAATTEVYVGTVTGAWKATPKAGTPPWDWAPFVNGLPQATVQDLSIWADPSGAAGRPRLLRAAVQARGVWEVDLAAATEPQQTYVRVHHRDDRRVFPTPMANPRLAPTAAAVNPFSSPDIIVRPQANPTNAPTWQLPGTTKIHAGNVPAYQLWTFQTAFRWLYPSIAADGQWTDQFADLVQLHRTVLALPAGRFIDRALWNAVVVNSHVAANGTVTAVATDPRAVYRAPWQSAMSLDAVATEVDLTELVVPPRDLNDVWQVYAEPSTVDVLIHHRDVRPLPANNAFAILLWRSAPTSAALLSTTVAGLPAFVASLATATPLPTPGGWNLVTPGAGATVHALRVPVDARMPRAVPIDVDLSGVTTTPNGHRVLLLAVVGSTRDPLTTPPTGAPATVVDLVKAWPNAAMRLVRVSRRPA